LKPVKSLIFEAATSLAIIPCTMPEATLPKAKALIVSKEGKLLRKEGPQKKEGTLTSSIP
jgi:hypothetical protein